MNLRTSLTSAFSDIFSIEVRNLLTGGSKWMWFLFVISGIVAAIEATVLATMLFLGFVILDQDVSGPLSGIFTSGPISNHSQSSLLVLLSVILIVLVIIRFAMALLFRYVTLKWSSIVVKSMHHKIMGGIISAPLKLFDERQDGSMVHDSINAPMGATAAIDSSAAIMGAIFLIGTFTVMLVVISPWLLLIAVIIGAIWFTTIVPQIRKRVRYQAQQRYDRLSDGTKIITDTISGIREIRSLSAESRWREKFSNTVDLWEIARVRMSLVQSISQPALQMLLQVGFATAIIFAAIVLSQANLTAQLPVLGTFAYALFRIYPVVGQISQSWITLAQTLPNLSAAAKWTELPGDPLAAGTQSISGPINKVEFDHVWFSYGENEPTIIDINFQIKTGTVTALVGASGVGKSTLIDLLLKFRAPEGGAIWVGHQNLSDVARQSWLSRVGLVRQDVFLLSSTIRDNLLEYKPEATEAELRLACLQAGATEFIDAMPNGLDTMLGERGVTLSGGQRQRIAIARALLRNSEVLILDEAMSALDGETEAMVLKSLLANSKSRMILLISHRLATVRHADHILVLDKGRVVEQGSHENLLAKHERYWDLFSTQMELESTVPNDVTRAQI